jgi:hypothetical protein
MTSTINVEAMKGKKLQYMYIIGRVLGANIKVGLSTTRYFDDDNDRMEQAQFTGDLVAANDEETNLNWLDTFTLCTCTCTCILHI